MKRLYSELEVFHIYKALTLSFRGITRTTYLRNPLYVHITATSFCVLLLSTVTGYNRMEPDCYFVAQVCAVEGKWRKKGEWTACRIGLTFTGNKQQQKELLPHSFYSNFTSCNKNYIMRS